MARSTTKLQFAIKQIIQVRQSPDKNIIFRYKIRYKSNLLVETKTLSSA